MTVRYSSIRCVKAAIADTLNDGEYDIDAIAAEAYKLTEGETNERGETIQSTIHFVQIVDDETYWEIVAKHEIA